MAPRSTVVVAVAGALLLAATVAGPQGPLPLRRLSTDAILDAMPAWSPDGRIVFHSRRPREEARGVPTRNIWAMPASGGAASRLSEGLADEYHPAVSPDGRRIAFVSESSGSRDIWVMGPDGSNPVPLTDGPGLEDHPAWSPDGRRIAYVALPKEGGNLDLWLMNDDGSAQRKLTFTAANEVFPAWHPDGRSLAFVTDAAGQFDVHALRLEDEETAPLLAGPEHETRPSFSPAGTRLAFARWPADESGDAARIWIANADGSLPTEIGLPAGSTNPAWSPAGSELAFQRRTDGGWEIWTARLPRHLLAGPRLDAAGARAGMTRDVIVLRDGTRPEGTLGVRTLAVRTSYGRLAIDVHHVASIGFAGLERGIARVLLRNGDTFSGFLEHESLALSGAVAFRIERIERVDLRGRGGAPLLFRPLRVVMRNGDSFAARPRRPALRLRIGGQRVEIPFAEVSRVDFAQDGERTRILTRKGEAMTAAVENALIEIELATGGRLGLHPAAIRTLTPSEEPP